MYKSEEEGCPKGKFMCAACNGCESEEGKVVFLFGVLLSVFLIAPWGVKICAKCAQKYNGIGIIMSLLLIPLITAIFFFAYR